MSGGRGQVEGFLLFTIACAPHMAAWKCSLFFKPQRSSGCRVGDFSASPSSALGGSRTWHGGGSTRGWLFLVLTCVWVSLLYPVHPVPFPLDCGRLLWFPRKGIWWGGREDLVGGQEEEERIRTANSCLKCPTALLCMLSSFSLFFWKAENKHFCNTDL